MTLLYIIASTVIISLLSMVGLLVFFTGEKVIKGMIVFLISLSAGTLMGGAFFHLLPEASKSIDADTLFTVVLASFIGFYLIERILHWRHCHQPHYGSGYHGKHKHTKKCKVHSFGYMNLIGDGIHNFLDGMIIAASFITDIRLGMITSVAIILHELPQEIGDFGVLIGAGFTKKRALLFNFMTALLALAGALVGYFLAGEIEGLTIYLLPIAAGGFLYIAASDLLPEIRKEEKIGKALTSFVIFMVGVVLMYSLKFLE